MMFLGKVIGTAVSTKKDDSLHGLKLLIVQALSDPKTPTGKPMIAIDTLGSAGYGELVYLARSRESSIPLGKELVAADAGIMGMVEAYYVTKDGGINK